LRCKAIIAAKLIFLCHPVYKDRRRETLLQIAVYRPGKGFDDKNRRQLPWQKFLFED
jgi:hypothetical protein